jgi:peptide deformylase
MEARVLQHELDHLDGVLMLDRISKEQRREAMRVLRGVDSGAARSTPS